MPANGQTFWTFFQQCLTRAGIKDWHLRLIIDDKEKMRELIAFIKQLADPGITRMSQREIVLDLEELTQRIEKIREHSERGFGNKSIIRLVSQEYDVSETTFVRAVIKEMERHGMKVDIHSLADLFGCAVQTLQTEKSRNPLIFKPLFEYGGDDDDD